MIDANKAKEVLIKMLKESEFDFTNPNPKLASKVFRDFFNIKVDCADDAILFQCGVYNFTGEELFSLEFVRQFTFETDEEYDHMEQLSLTIYYKPNKELLGLETNLWTYDCTSIEEFFDEVENMEHFKLPIEKYKPFQSIVEQGVV